MSDLTQLIPMLSSDNYKVWRDKMLIALGCMNLDLALCMDEPSIPTKLSMESKRTSYERSNRLSMLLIKTHISQIIRGSILECKTVKDLMEPLMSNLQTPIKH